MGMLERVVVLVLICAAILAKRTFNTADQCAEFLRLARQYQQG